MKLAISSAQLWTRRMVVRSTSRTWNVAMLPQQRSFASVVRGVGEIEKELNQEHGKVKHSFDSSPRGLDIPQNKQEMQHLHDVYNRISSLERELNDLKEMVKQNAKVFAVDGPDGYSDDELQLEQDMAQSLITENATTEDTSKIEAKHNKAQNVKEFHARDPEHDW